MTAPADSGPEDRLARMIEVRPIGLDDHASLRYLHAACLLGQSEDGLSQADAEAFVRLVYSPLYSDLMLEGELYGGWLHGELVGSACWHAIGDQPAIARLGPVVVRHTRFGIGRHLLSVVEERALAAGIQQFTAWTTANAVPFFERFGYEVASRGVKTLSPECTLPVTFLRKSV
ncbi:MAG: GNAT family N-acetyltransferase, partial [Hyphomicrobiaceae bacterium]